ncbi:MAG: hypothetical protein ACI91J_003522, partial [Yoonia sp.]
SITPGQGEEEIEEAIESGAIVQVAPAISAFRNLEVDELGKSLDQFVRLIAELTSVPEKERSAVIQQCIVIVEQHKKPKSKQAKTTKE